MLSIQRTRAVRDARLPQGQGRRVGRGARTRQQQQPGAVRIKLKNKPGNFWLTKLLPFASLGGSARQRLARGYDFCVSRVEKMPHLRLAGNVTVDPFLQLTIRRGATFLVAVYSNESSQQRRAKGTKNGCTSDTQRA